MTTQDDSRKDDAIHEAISWLLFYFTEEAKISTGTALVALRHLDAIQQYALSQSERMKPV
jgi:hypothetical protein